MAKRNVKEKEIMTVKDLKKKQIRRSAKEIAKLWKDISMNQFKYQRTDNQCEIYKDEENMQIEEIMEKKQQKQQD